MFMNLVGLVIIVVGVAMLFSERVARPWRYEGLLPDWTTGRLGRLARGLILIVSGLTIVIF